MINRNLVLASSLLVFLLIIVALVYLYSQSNQLEQKIIELESNRQQHLDIIYPQPLDKDISTSLAEIDARIKAIEETLQINAK